MTPDQRETVALCLEEVAKLMEGQLQFVQTCSDGNGVYMPHPGALARSIQDRVDELRLSPSSPVILRGAEAATSELFRRMRDLIAKHMTAAIPALDTSSPEGGPTRINMNDDGTMDEIVADKAYIHIEQMSDGHYWANINDGVHVYTLNFVAKGGKIKLNMQKDSALDNRRAG